MGGKWKFFTMEKINKNSNTQRGEIVKWRAAVKNRTKSFSIKIELIFFFFI